MTPPEPAPLPLSRRLAGYAVFVLASVAILFAGQRLDRADLTAPFFYGGDALLILPMVKETVEHGSHWRTERLGAPGVQELHDFPVVDHLHFAVIWLLSRAWPDPIGVFNLYHLLTYPLTVLTALLVLRHFGLSFPAAGCAAILYAFLPHHYIRGLGHYFLAAYYFVPLTVVPILWVCRGRLPFFQEIDGRYRWAFLTRDALTSVVIALMTASAGAYYAFFGCALFVFAGLYGWVALRTWRAAASAGLVTAVIVLGGIANHAPAITYQAKYGPNAGAHARQSEEAEEYGMKLTHLLLPTAGHNSRFLAAVQSAYDSSFRPLQTENRSNTLGFVGAVGFVVLLAVVALPVRKRWPLGPLSALTIFGTLLGTVGGLGSLFAFLVTPQVRCYDRVAVYLAFFALFAACCAADQILGRRPVWARCRWPVFLALTVFGIWDQTNRTWFNPAIADARDDAARRYREDAAYFAQVETAMPGGMVFVLPFVPYPETLAVGKLSGYDHAAGYLHTKTVHWSFGAMKGREADQWQREVAVLPAEEMLKRLVLRGFDGLFVDRGGYEPAAADKLFADVRRVLGPDALHFDHPDGQQLVFDLRPYRDRLRQELGDQFDALAKQEAEAVRVLWLDGFVSFEKPGEEWRHRWCGPTGEAVFVNPTDRPRTVKLEMMFHTFTDDPADVRIDGGELWAERFPVNRHTAPIERTLVVPPGRHTVRFRAKMPPGELPRDSRRLTFFIAGFRMTQ